MIARLAPLALLLALPACMDDEEIPPLSQAEVQAGFDELLALHLDAVAGRDLDALSPTLAEDVTVIFPNGQEVVGREAVIDFHREWFSDDQWIWEPEVIESHAATGGLANALVRYTYRDTADGEPRQRWLALHFRNDGQGWLLYHDQNTPIEVPLATGSG